MKAKAWLWLAGVVAIMAAVPAHADQRGQRLHRFLQERQQEQQQQQQREFRREQRQEFQQGRGRLTPEERRQLRRDIQDAGQDVYRREPPPPSLPRGF
jgi:hypothetical protein